MSGPREHPDAGAESDQRDPDFSDPDHGDRVAPGHPAAFSQIVLEVMAVIVDNEIDQRGEAMLLDPFAGIGRVHRLQEMTNNANLFTYGIELEPEWADQHPCTDVGDARALPFRDRAFDIVATSPAYGNRMADHHEARDVCKRCDGSGADGVKARILGSPVSRLCRACGGSGLSKRMTYRHQLGRPLSEGNSGAMQWGEEYRQLHREAWREVRRVLVPGGLFLLNISDHVRKGKVVAVSAWHWGCLKLLGFELVDDILIDTPRMGFGANREVRVENEHLLVMRAPNGNRSVYRNRRLRNSYK